MRMLFLIPLLALALACAESPVLEPDADATFSSASQPALVLTWLETFDQQYAGDVRSTPSGILQMRDIDNGFSVTGDLVGYVHVYGRAMIDLRTGIGNGSGSMRYDLTEPGVGSLDCDWSSKITGFPVFEQEAHATCLGSGYFEGWKVKTTGDNFINPGVGIYAYIGEVR